MQEQASSEAALNPAPPPPLPGGWRAVDADPTTEIGSTLSPASPELSQQAELSQPSGCLAGSHPDQPQWPLWLLVAAVLALRRLRRAVAVPA